MCATDLSDGLANTFLKSAAQSLILLKGRIEIQSASIYQAQSQVKNWNRFQRVQNTTPEREGKLLNGA